MTGTGGCELERLTIVRTLDVLAGGGDDHLRRLAARAADRCAAPMAFVLLAAGERQWLAGRVGVDVAATPRSWACCSPSPDRSPVVVADVALDPRFASDPLLQLLGGRSFVGVPFDLGSEAVGTLCVVDRHPRRLVADQVAALGEIAEQVALVCEVAYRRAQQAATLARCGDIVASPVVGVWELDGDDVTVFANEAMAGLLATSPRDMLGRRFESFLPDDVPAEPGRLAELLQRGPGVHETRLRRADGGEVWVRMHAGSSPGAPGDHALTAAIVVDVTEAKHAEAELAEQRTQLQALVAHLPGLVFVADAGTPWGVHYVSSGCVGLTGYDPDDFLTGRVFYGDLMVRDDRTWVASTIRSAVAQGVRYTVTYRINHRDGSTRWVWEQGAPRDDGRLEGLILDVTSQVEADTRRRESEARYRHLVEHSPDAILLSRQGRILYANRAAEHLLAPAGPLVGDAVLAYVHPDDHAVALMRGPIGDDAGCDEAPVEYRVRTGDGRFVEVEARCVSVITEGAPATEMILRDISERVRAERVRTALQGVFEQIAAGRPLADILDAIARIVEERLPGRLCSILLVRDGRVHDGAGPSLDPAYRAAIDGAEIGPKAGSCGTAAWRGEPVAVADIAVDPLWEDFAELARAAGLAACWSQPITLHDGTVAATFGVYGTSPGMPSEREWEVLAELRDLTAVAIEHTTSRAALEHGATFDDLTGLPNRRTLRHAMREALTAAAPGRAVAVLFIDLDDFKDVNDSLGHAAGDAVLRAVADLLTSSVREGDLVARFSGDEFVICCQGIDRAAEVEDIVARVHAALRHPFHHDDHVLHLRASIGIAVSEGDDSPERLLANADAAMYRAKERGDGGRAWFDEQLRDRASRRLELEAALVRALDAGELEVRYQPTVRLSDGVVVGAEALARWHRPGHGAVAPAEFIPVAEASGLIVALGAEVLHRACAAAAAWQRLRPDPPCVVSVNVSGKQLRHQQLVETVHEALADTGLPPHLLRLELTESILMDEDAAAILRRIEELGVTVSIDDFGTGYSSLAYLKRLPLDQLKVDRSFVAELDRSTEDGAIVAAVIAMARALGADVVAEGVETEVQRASLAQLGCDVAQGFLWSPAVPREAFDSLLHTRFAATAPA